MNEAFVEINKVRTKITTWGRWIEESPGTTNQVIILIPGNPGVTGFYKQFAKTLYEKTEIPVWCVGHAGHNFADDSITKFPKFEENKELYGLKGQVDHKIDFFRRYVPSGTKAFVIGHSIGSYMSLEILNHPEVSPKVEKAYLLFPTVERMAESKNGKFLVNIVRPIIWLVLFLTWIFTILPSFLQNFLLYIYMLFANIPYTHHADNIKDLLKPGILKRVFFLAYEEMDQVQQRNDATIVKNINRLKFYYGKTDGWAPESYCAQLKRDIPNVHAELTEINHTFVFLHNTEVACKCAEWITLEK